MSKDDPHQQCTVCRKDFPVSELVGWLQVRPALSRLIARDVPEWGENCQICWQDLKRYRERYLTGLLADEDGEIGQLEAQVAEALAQGNLLTPQTSETHEPTSFGDRMADRVAAGGGSWAFIFFFLAVLVVWMIVNTVGLLTQPFDPYPYILLNLVLSCVAALQAPVIMMSQRRQEAKDRERAQNDYLINLKAELELRQLHDKLDHQMVHQWRRLLEIQQIQIDLLQELRKEA